MTVDYGVAIATHSARLAAASLDGANSNLHTLTGISVGYAGTGMLTVNNGATVTVDNGFSIGETATGVGTAVIGGAGTGTILTGAWGLTVANYGTGTLTVNSGATMTTPYDFDLGVQPGSQGTASINNGGTVTANGGSWVGGWFGAVGGKGVLNVNAGGTLNVSGTLGLTTRRATK